MLSKLEVYILILIKENTIISYKEDSINAPIILGVVRYLRVFAPNNLTGLCN